MRRLLRIGANRQRLGMALAALVLPLLLLTAHHPSALAGTPAAEPTAAVLAADPECRRYDRCQEDLHSVFGSLDIERLSEELRTPRLFTIAGTLTLQWNPNGHPGWSPEQLALGCRTSVCRFSGWRDQQILERPPMRIWTGRFELQTDEQTSLALYPFDQHWPRIKLISKDPQSREVLYSMEVSDFDISLAPQLLAGKTSNFHVNHATFGSSTMFRQGRRLHHRDPRCRGDGGGAVAGGIVDHDHLDGLEALAAQRREQVGEGAFLVAGRDQHGNPRLPLQPVLGEPR